MKGRTAWRKSELLNLMENSRCRALQRWPKSPARTLRMRARLRDLASHSLVHSHTQQCKVANLRRRSFMSSFERGIDIARRPWQRRIEVFSPKLHLHIIGRSLIRQHCSAITAIDNLLWDALYFPVPIVTRRVSYTGTEDQVFNQAFCLLVFASTCT